MRRFFVSLLCFLFLPAAFTIHAQTDDVVITVDLDEVLHEVSPYVYGINHGPWAFVPADYVDDVGTLGINYLRFPGGNWGDLNPIQDYEFNDVMFWADRMGADVSVSVNLRTGTPEDAAELVQYALDNDFEIPYWAIGNEPDLFGEEWDTERYNAEWRRFADAMLAVDPDIQFIGPDISQYTGNPETDPRDENGILWLDSFLEANGDRVSVVSVHRYPFPSFSEPVTSIDALRESTLEWSTLLLTLRETVLTITGDEKPTAITEVNSHWSSAIGGEASPDSHFNAIWWADVLGQNIFHDTEIVAYFTLQSNPTVGGYGIYSRSDIRPTYYVYRMYQHFGNQVVNASSSHDFVTAYAALREDRRVSVMLINLMDDAQTVTLNLRGEAEMLTFAVDTVPTDFEAVSVDESLDLPAQSISVLLVEADR